MDFKFQKLWEKLVPKSGQADTVQGELVRDIGNMQDEFLANGYANWDEGYEIFASFLESVLSDGTFDLKTTKNLLRNLSTIKEYGRGLKPQGDIELAHKQIQETVVQWCEKHLNLIQRPNNPKLKR